VLTLKYANVLNPLISLPYQKPASLYPNV